MPRLQAETLAAVSLSANNGGTWRRILTVGKLTSTYALYIAADGQIFAALDSCCPVNKVQLFRSKNEGKDWSSILEVANSTAVGSIVVSSKGTIFVGLTIVGD